jgi:hypothetical protein
MFIFPRRKGFLPRCCYNYLMFRNFLATHMNVRSICIGNDVIINFLFLNLDLFL